MRHYHVTTRRAVNKFVVRSTNRHLFKAVAKESTDNITAVAQQRIPPILALAANPPPAALAALPGGGGVGRAERLPLMKRRPADLAVARKAAEGSFGFRNRHMGLGEFVDETRRRRRSP